VNIQTVAQLASAASETFIAVVVLVSYYLFVRVYRAQLEEMRAARTAGGRPQVIVTADYTRLPLIDIVVRNVGGGSAKDIEFDFSTPVVNSTGHALSDEIGYFKRGMGFLAAGEEVKSFWDNFNDLLPVLRERGIEEGITVSVRYRDLAEEAFEDEWNINPLIHEGEQSIRGFKGVEELVEVVEKISKDVEALAQNRTEQSRDDSRQ